MRLRIKEKLTTKESEILMITAQAARYRVSNAMLTYEDLEGYPYYGLSDDNLTRYSINIRDQDVTNITYRDLLKQIRTKIESECKKE